MLEERFKKYIADNGLIAPGDRVLLAVSGGVDSMVMTSLFAEAGFDFGVAHCNFQLRGEESEEDEVSVEKLAARCSVPFYNRRFDTRGEMERTGESMEMAARRLRYDWFAELSRDEHYTSVAIAHHADDSIETFFINLLRGTGLKGLTGISVVNGRVIRPLIFASRKEILEYAMAHKIAFREDSSNRSTKYLRNKIRLGIVPRLREINPKFTDIMGANIKRLTDAQTFISRTIDHIRSIVVTNVEGIDYIDPSKIDPLLPVDFVIYELMNTGWGFKGDVIDQLIHSFQNHSTGKRFYSAEYVASVDRDRIAIAPIEEGDCCQTDCLIDTAKLYCGNSVLYFEHLDIGTIESLITAENVALIDSDKLRFPLHIRRWREGDWFIPLGMNGRKKVSDFLVDSKVSSPEKARQFVLLNGEEIVWIIGRRIDDRYKVDHTTDNVLRVTKEII